MGRPVSYFTLPRVRGGEGKEEGAEKGRRGRRGEEESLEEEREWEGEGVGASVFPRRRSPGTLSTK